VGGLFDPAHNPLFSVAPTGTVARKLLDFLRDPAPDGTFHDFTDTAESTRFLGDLYQNISEAARKRYALLQTPDFVVDFILDRTLEPALREFALRDFRLMDPACGSGHFLLAAFDRLFQRWVRDEPATEVTVLAQRALDAVCGVDINPYAVAIARFRLLIAAVKACGIKRLSEAHNWRYNVITADSLLFGARAMVNPQMLTTDVEDPQAIGRVLHQQRYHAVVGNPPYINVQDSALRGMYRGLYDSCSGKYQISVPFTELFFHVAASDGYVGMITSNAFMKRNFGKKLIEECLPMWDITHVIDTKGVYLPGHGTPTVLILGRHRAPIAKSVRVLRGIQGEKHRPQDPARAPVWTAIISQVDNAGSETVWFSAEDVPRGTLSRYPWAMGGGGAVDLKELLDEQTDRLSAEITSAGYMAIISEESFFAAPDHYFSRQHVISRPFGVGESIGDWTIDCSQSIFFPLEFHPYLWPYRTTLRNRRMFGKTPEEMGNPWYFYMQFKRRS
jgi:hypothetical protein